MIKHFEVTGLQGKRDYCLDFHPDLNILTGKNGSGKTTLLKLLWYCLSGNIQRIPDEMTFRSILIETTSFKLRIFPEDDSSSASQKYELEIDGQKIELPEQQNLGLPLALPLYLRSSSIGHIDVIRNAISEIDDSSVFFPTFRRIEGGYALDQRRRGLRQSNPLQEALSNFSDAFDVGRHHFVASISTEDIVRLLTSKYALISRHTDALHKRLAENITKMIRDYEKEEKKLENAQATLEKIQSQLSGIEVSRNKLLQPFVVLTALTKQILQHKGIKVTDAITFGETAESITSDKLSAGEKQMLSFLCYNAFNSKSCIIIDEPEISLHVDWQRILFPTLLQQSTTNQFIIATHSPFIYSKYSDKELVLNPDKGDN